MPTRVLEYAYLNSHFHLGLTVETVCRTGCLLIDQHMPGTSGLDVVDNLRKRGIQPA